MENQAAKLIEAQALGPSLASHLKHQIAGLIPITAKGSKELGAELRARVAIWERISA